MTLCGRSVQVSGAGFVRLWVRAKMLVSFDVVSLGCVTGVRDLCIFEMDVVWSVGSGFGCGLCKVMG